jgi:hypothetical protein
MKFISFLKQMRTFGIVGASSAIGFSLLPLMEGKTISPIMFIWFFLCASIFAVPIFYDKFKEIK